MSETELDYLPRPKRAKKLILLGVLTILGITLWSLKMKIKLFLVLLFCAVTVTAQERYNPYQKKGDIVIRDDSRIFEQWLVDEWQSYRKECYADSQYVGFGYWLSADGMKWWHEVSEDETRWSMTKPFKRYDHREPTFIGFMDYLERRIK